jgi:hypothetical protein
MPDHKDETLRDVVVLIENEGDGAKSVLAYTATEMTENAD